MVRAAVRACWSMVTVISVSRARISCLRSRGVVEGASKTARMSAPAAASHRTSSPVRELGRRACPAARALAAGRLAAQVGGLGGAVVAGPDPAAAAAVIPGAHHPAAAAAAQQALQQPAALPDRAAALPGRGGAVRVQFLLVAQVLL